MREQAVERVRILVLELRQNLLDGMPHGQHKRDDFVVPESRLEAREPERRGEQERREQHTPPRAGVSGIRTRRHEPQTPSARACRPLRFSGSPREGYTAIVAGRRA